MANRSGTLKGEVQVFFEDDAGEGAFFAQLFVAFVSFSLLVFYSYQYIHDRCLVYPIYVQGVTAINYTLGAFRGRQLYASLLFIEGYGPRIIMIGRYLSWVITCPAILMGFYQTIGLLGPRIPITTINTIVVCDLCLLGLGIIGAFQTSIVSKAVFLSLACMVAGLIVFDTIKVERARIDSYMGSLRTWLVGATALFLASWAIFPVLFFLGTPGFDLISPEFDVIATSVGDLLAKNLFGFIIWYMRFNVIYPFITEQESNTSQDGRLVQYNGPRQDGLSNNNKGSKKGKVLLVEPDVMYQRLFLYLLKEIKYQVVIAFDLTQAIRTLSRSRLDEFDAVLLNLSPHFINRGQAIKIKQKLSQPPFLLPIIGYSTRDQDRDALEMEMRRTELSHTVVLPFLDSKYLAKVLVYCKQVERKRRESHLFECDESMHSPPGQDPLQGRVCSFQDVNTMPDLVQTKHQVPCSPPLSPRFKPGMSRCTSETAIINTENPFRHRNKQQKDLNC